MEKRRFGDSVALSSNRIISDFVMLSCFVDGATQREPFTYGSAEETHTAASNTITTPAHLNAPSTCFPPGNTPYIARN